MVLTLAQRRKALRKQLVVMKRSRTNYYCAGMNWSAEPTELGLSAAKQQLPRQH